MTASKPQPFSLQMGPTGRLRYIQSKYCSVEAPKMIGVVIEGAGSLLLFIEVIGGAQAGCAMFGSRPSPIKRDPNMCSDTIKYQTDVADVVLEVHDKLDSA